MSENNSSGEDVKTQDVPNSEAQTGEEKKDMTPEQIAKALEEKENYKKAMQTEREEKKTLAEKLAMYEAQEKEREEKEKKKKWQYEELLTEKEKTISELTEKASAWDKYQEENTQRVQKELSELLSKTPKELVEENKDLLDDLSDEKKIKFLQRLTVSKKDFDPTSEKGIKVDVNTEYEKAKKEGNISEMLRLSNLKTK